MKHIRTHIVLILLFSSFCGLRAENEQALFLQTTKDLYISGETIDFKCTQFTAKPVATPILYVDICGERNTIASQILQPLNQHWEGHIPIPDTLQTGVYLLRVYYGTDSGKPILANKVIPIVNRFGNNETNENRKMQTGYTAFYPQKSAQTPLKGLSIVSNRKSVQTNASIKFQLSNTSNKDISGISMLVAKRNKHTQKTASSDKFSPYTPNPRIKIFPELYLRGKLTNSGNPVANEMLLLSVPDSIPGIRYSQSDSRGEFNFWLKNIYGKQDVVIQTIKKDLPLDIEVYPMFLEAPSKIPFFVEPQLEESEMVNLAINRVTLHQAYQESISDSIHKSEDTYPFFGFTEFKVVPSDYIALKDFNEIAWEILPIVKYKYEEEKTQLRLWDPTSKAYYGNPWILVDGIPVFNAGDINVLNSEKIAWIKIQPQIRCYSDLFIEGALVIQTNSGDFSEVALPKNAIRTQIDTYFRNDKTTNTLPLFRDVLFWAPHLSFKGEQQIEVPTTYEKGDYRALLEMIDSEGNCYQSSYDFTIE